ncbi:unnamed protein product, partial [marine sediment metagenome]
LVAMGRAIRFPLRQEEEKIMPKVDRGNRVLERTIDITNRFT